MSSNCAAIHEIVKKLKRYHFPFEESEIPLNGIYLLYEKDEIGHHQDRIVRVGTHTGDNQLRSRLKQHFLKENKDRSIFRKNIGRALLNKHSDPFIKFWEIDLTPLETKEKYNSSINFNYMKRIESQVSHIIQENFSFVVFEVSNKEERLELESKLISTISWCEKCKPSKDWLGNYSTKEKIVKSGLWLVNELYKEPLNATGIEYFSRIVNKQHTIK